MSRLFPDYVIGKKDQKRKKIKMMFANIYLQTILAKILHKATKTSYNYILIKQF